MTSQNESIGQASSNTSTGRRNAVVNGKHDFNTEQIHKDAGTSSSEENPKNAETKSQVDVLWQQMNKGVSKEMLHRLTNKCNSMEKKVTKKTSSNWMTYLGLPPKVTGDVTHNADAAQKLSKIVENTANDEAKRIAGAALAAVKDAAAAAAAASGKGKIVVTEVRDFAGQEIEIKKVFDSDSKEMVEKTKANTSAVDAVLEQIKKKPKLSVLDKTKKDWGEFKEENKGLEDELDAYKKSSNQYLDKVSFLQRTDYREFERERDARLALQARRRPDMQEEP